MDVFPAEAQLIHGAGGVVLHDHVGPPHQAVQDLGGVRVLQVQAEAALRPTRGGEGGRHLAAEEDPDEVRVGVALHLHDVGAVLGQHPSALDANAPVAEVCDPKATQRHVGWPARSSVDPESWSGEDRPVFSDLRGPEAVADPLSVDLPQACHDGGLRPTGHLGMDERAPGVEVLLGQDVGR